MIHGGRFSHHVARFTTDVSPVPDQIQLQVHNSGARPTLIYLPGLHGDWTLIAGFRQALNGRVRFVGCAYPQTLTWSLDQYAAAVESVLAQNDITSGWFLAESFGSQLVWRLSARGKFRVEGVVLAGGFARHPVPWGAKLAATLGRQIPLTLIKVTFQIYGQISRWRFRGCPETLAGITAYIARLDQRCRLAAVHRLHLVAQSDPRSAARNLSAPLYAAGGGLDPIVPWFYVRTWLKRECPALRDYKIFWRADHNVLGTAPAAAAEQILSWISESQ
jgi:pimeloyl-ACP methyl ester carboxylesterase